MGCCSFWILCRRGPKPKTRLPENTSLGLWGPTTGIGSAADDIMQALADPNTCVIGVCGRDEKVTYLLTIIERRVRAHIFFGVTFDVVVRIGINKNSKVAEIQQEIADKLGLCLQGEARTYASQLFVRIMNEQRILIIISGIQGTLEWHQLGIPLGTVHQGCKLVLATVSKEVLTQHLQTQRNIILSSPYVMNVS